MIDSARGEPIAITYEVEQTDAGWVVWRTLPGRPPVAVGYIMSARANSAHPTRRSAENAIDRQRLADRAAATRLGVVLA